ncbi:MAG: DMT family transporter [Campylobacteraceae bacterium]|nr:DMT family transporter [Campylobacteraceae bacterium]
MNKLKAEFILIYVAFSWGIGFPLMKLALDENDTFTILWLRFSFAALIFAPFLIKSKGIIKIKTLLLGLVLGIFLFLTFAFFIIGLNHTSSSNTGFLAGLGIIFVPIFLAIIRQKLPAIDSFISALLGITGIIIISGVSIGYVNKGDLFVIIGAITSSIHIIILDLYAKEKDSILLTFIQLLVMAILAMLVAFYYNNLLPKEFSSTLLITVSITAVLSTAIAFWLQTKYQSQTTADRAVLIFSLEPIFAVIFASLILSEEITLSLVLGGGIIVLAMTYPLFHSKIKSRYN